MNFKSQYIHIRAVASVFGIFKFESLYLVASDIVSSGVKNCESIQTGPKVDSKIYRNYRTRTGPNLL